MERRTGIDLMRESLLGKLFRDSFRGIFMVREIHKDDIHNQPVEIEYLTRWNEADRYAHYQEPKTERTTILDIALRIEPSDEERAFAITNPRYVEFQKSKESHTP